MRNKQHLVNEIVQLCAIKGSCKYFLASERSMFEVENATQVRINLSVINRSLSDLYKELNEVENRKAESLKLVGRKDYQPSLNSVMLFNADRRFTLRE